MTISNRVTFRSLLLTATILACPLIAGAPTPAAAQIAVGLSVQIAPPLLPVYVQPAMPEVGYMWTPGYWAYGTVGYYWVPGTWIQPPLVGVLWTPPYWGWANGGYLFHGGYWGPQVGFYGGVNYGYGYGGSGYQGGRWDGGHFAYNQSANNFGSVHVANAYSAPLTGSNHSNTSFVGGANGLKAEPTAQERSAETERHTPATAEQTSHVTASARDPALAASHNNGHPALAATSRPAGAERAGAHPQAATAAHQGEPANAAHPATHAAGPAAVAHPAERTAGSEQAAHPAGRTAASEQAARPAAAQAVQHPAARAAARPAVAHAAAPRAAVARAAAPRAAVHPAVAHAAAPHAAPARAARPAEKR
jgi:hypothetical protein